MIAWKRVCIGVSAVLLLTACGEPADTDSDAPANPEQEIHEEEEETALSVEEVLLRSVDVMTAVKSISSELQMQQTMQFPDGETFTSDSEMVMDFIQKPLATYQKMIVDVPEMGEIETEMYLVDNEIYFRDAMENAWFTYPDELAQNVSELQTRKIEPTEQLELLLKYADHLTIEEEAKHYRIHVEGAASALPSFAEELNGLVNEEFANTLDSMANLATIEALDYTLLIDKETFYQTQMDMSMDFSLTLEGEALPMQTTTSASFSRFNEIESIDIPAEVLDAAEEFNLEYTEFEEVG
ncbi:DUF6612 family protein [Halalkalibacter oceani]|uniref:DUF2092 domain-containing protein n=1 Tax=Halalkalibacter oceani TaxID=1653776 RepID=A0A9X2DQ53_9BACI|nr:DUF6612 family protein [Halalkalibacter oceani]MCM3714646.1 hypothetical protein [Halalkalibacter oceani]